MGKKKPKMILEGTKRLTEEERGQMMARIDRLIREGLTDEDWKNFVSAIGAAQVTKDWGEEEAEAKERRNALERLGLAPTEEGKAPAGMEETAAVGEPKKGMRVRVKHCLVHRSCCNKIGMMGKITCLDSDGPEYPIRVKFKGMGKEDFCLSELEILPPDAPEPTTPVAVEATNPKKPVVGDRVRVLPIRNKAYHSMRSAARVGHEGRVWLIVTSSNVIPYQVKFPGGYKTWYDADELEILPDEEIEPEAVPEPEPAVTPSPRLNVGDTVKVLDTAPRYLERFIGKQGVITESGPAGYTLEVVIPGNMTWWFHNEDLELVHPADPSLRFTIGDTVKILGYSGSSPDFLGQLGKIISDDHDGQSMQVKVQDGRVRLFSRDQLELVPASAPPTDLILPDPEPTATLEQPRPTVGQRVKILANPENKDIDPFVGLLGTIRIDAPEEFLDQPFCVDLDDVEDDDLWFRLSEIEVVPDVPETAMEVLIRLKPTLDEIALQIKEAGIGYAFIISAPTSEEECTLYVSGSYEQKRDNACVGAANLLIQGFKSSINENPTAF